MNYGIIFNDGNLDIKDFREECQKEKWLPLTVLRKRDEGTTHVPVFSNSNTAHNFMKRNFDTKKYICGIMILTQEDMEQFDSKGWEVIRMKFPRRIGADHPEYDLDVEVVEISEEPFLNSYSKANLR